MIENKCPTRVDFAGGTLDCWPLFAFLGPSYTINLSISVFTQSKIKWGEGQQVQVNIASLNKNYKFKNVAELCKSEDSNLSLLIQAVQFFKVDRGFEFELSSQSPIGGGLGGSSSLLISILKSFLDLTKKKMTITELVELAHNLEAQVLNTPTGTQDYVPAAQPGLNAILYSAEGLKIEKIDFDSKYFDDRMLLVYTGKPHHSGINNWAVIKNAVEKDKNTMTQLRAIQETAFELYISCKEKKWKTLPELFKKDYLARTKLSDGFTSSEIKSLESIVAKKGAESIKICGAGGGGCVMIWSAPEDKSAIATACKEQGYQVIEAKSVS